MPEPGTLVLVVGPSGAGKDTLLEAARRHLQNNDKFVFARRMITRPADAGGEDHDAISPDEFENHVKNDKFLLHWQAHGLGYGLPVSYEQLRQAGHVVIANVSRQVVAPAQQNLAPLKTICVTAPAKVRAERMASRGREAPAEIEQRLLREEALEDCLQDVQLVKNTGSLQEGVRSFLQALES
ncbi:MAG: phosphonate metabolism protein/1,5-bisphosphokinase (PRPP-forming) PhnN [Proteobacteria bacterium]|nr:phosphonate metabolism protein/1,5-bisphosphokinase (PRPP-forming) PhnN [Pseudomonadota bacterium]